MALFLKFLTVQRVGFKSDFHSCPPDNLPLLDVLDSFDTKTRAAGIR